MNFLLRDSQMKLKFKARVNRSAGRSGTRLSKSLRRAPSGNDEFVVEVEMEGGNARELNRMSLSALRRVEKRTTLRAEWTSGDGTSERFFDHVLKKTIKN
jgi:hypothetical protein